MKILLILGPTGIGKTNLSIELAKKNNCPVIVLDRIQCYSEMSILSGRPNESEYKGTNRIYLSNLYVKDGENIDNELLMKKLKELLNDIQQKLIKQINFNNKLQISNQNNYDCIIEGGSITLVNELFNNGNINNKFKISSIIYLRPDDNIENHKKYFSKISKRVKQMCFPNINDHQYFNSNDSMLTEVNNIIKNNSYSVRAILRSLVGVVAIDKVMDYLDYINDNNNLSIIDSNQLNLLNNELVKNISLGHYNYALSQIKIFDKLISNLPNSILITKKNITL